MTNFVELIEWCTTIHVAGEYRAQFHMDRVIHLDQGNIETPRHSMLKRPRSALEPPFSKSPNHKMYGSCGAVNMLYGVTQYVKATVFYCIFDGAIWPLHVLPRFVL